MRLAAESMAECVREPLLTKEQLMAYKQAHHKMRRLIKDWNRIEQEREAKTTGHRAVIESYGAPSN